MSANVVQTLLVCPEHGHGDFRKTVAVNVDDIDIARSDGYAVLKMRAPSLIGYRQRRDFVVVNFASRAGLRGFLNDRHNSGSGCPPLPSG